MVSPTVNVRPLPFLPIHTETNVYILDDQVVRYSALFSGILYGWYHRRTLQAEATKHKIEQATHHQEKLIEEAKAAWKRKQEGPSTNGEHAFSGFSSRSSNSDTPVSFSSHHRPRPSSVRPGKAHRTLGEGLIT